MKRSVPASSVVTQPYKRQASLAAFLQPKVKSKLQTEPKVEVVTIVDTDLAEEEETPRLDKGKGKEVEELHVPSPTLITPYPPSNHPSYHPPPTPIFNHPIVIAPLTSSLQSISFNTSSTPILKPDLDLDLLYLKKFIDPQSSGELAKYLLEELPWYRVKYMIRGNSINTPRFTTVFGKDSTDIPWTGYMKCKPRAIPEILLKLMQKVEEVTGETYNFALVNYYSSGSDSISYHSDSESFLGPNPTIASLSLGGTRDFFLRHVDYKSLGTKVQVEKFVLKDGDMVIMRGKTQHQWQHSIPKRASAEGRINITFRKGIVKYATENYYNYNVGKGAMMRWKNGKMVEVE